MKNPYHSVAKRLYRLRKRPMVARRLGALWLLYPKDWIDNRILVGRPYEVLQLAFAQDCIRSHKTTVFFDCGANIGLYSVLLALNVPQLKVLHAFEPVSQTWGRLVTNLALNGQLDRATAHKYGLGEGDGQYTISIDIASSGTATLDREEKTNPKRAFRRQEQVLIHAFDARFKGEGERAFFKIDLEGYEAKALKGMENYLKNNLCVIQIELWARNQQSITDWLEQRGYKKFHQIEADSYFSNERRS